MECPFDVFRESSSLWNLLFGHICPSFPFISLNILTIVNLKSLDYSWICLNSGFFLFHYSSHFPAFYSCLFYARCYTQNEKLQMKSSIVRGLIFSLLGRWGEENDHFSLIKDWAGLAWVTSLVRFSSPSDLSLFLGYGPS